MTRPLLQGELVRLTAIQPEMDAELEARWSQDAGYTRLLTTEPPVPWTVKKVKEEMEKEDSMYSNFFFAIRTLDGNELIGFIGVDSIRWNHGTAWVGVGIGNREYWSKGYGTDAIREMLRYAFRELNLHRITLDVFGYNKRAIRSYEKAGFTHEGTIRQWINRDGKRWDVVFMGILRSEWEALESS